VVIAGLVRFGISTVRPSEEVAALVHRMSHRSVGRVVVTRSDGSLVGLFFAEDAPAVDEHKPSLSGDDI
jgi:predicted transcriptional regulator